MVTVPWSGVSKGEGRKLFDIRCIFLGDRRLF